MKDFRAAASCWLDFGLLRNLQRIVHLNAEVANRTFQLGMAKQQLNGPQVLRALIDKGGLGPSHRVRPVGRRILPGSIGLVMHNSRILACRDVGRPR